MVEILLVDHLKIIEANANHSRLVLSTMPKREATESAAENAAPSSSGKKQKVRELDQDESLKVVDAAVVETDDVKNDKVDLAVLEKAYKEALAIFKKDKTNKDMRRAKSAAKKAWDAAVAAASGEGAEQLICKDCSHMFLFHAGEQEFYVEQGWKHKPTRCASCNESYKARLMDRSKRDSKDRNMCFAFRKRKRRRKRKRKRKKSEGKASKQGESKEKAKKEKEEKEEKEETAPAEIRAGVSIGKKGVCFAFQKGECDRGDLCKFNHVAKAQ
jgi:septum formation inhibitor MinC